MRIATELLEAERELQQAQREHDGSGGARARYAMAVARVHQAELAAVIELDRRADEDEKVGLCGRPTGGPEGRAFGSR